MNNERYLYAVTFYLYYFNYWYIFSILFTGIENKYASGLIDVKTKTWYGWIINKIKQRGHFLLEVRIIKIKNETLPKIISLCDSFEK